MKKKSNSKKYFYQHKTCSLPLFVNTDKQIILFHNMTILELELLTNQFFLLTTLPSR